MSEDEGRKQVALGEAAYRYLQDPVATAAIEEMERRIYEQWRESQTVAEREDLWRLRTNLAEFVHMLGLFVQKGRLARGGQKLA